jgi:hypothetical protein
MFMMISLGNFCWRNEGVKTVMTNNCSHAAVTTTSAFTAFTAFVGHVDGYDFLSNVVPGVLSVDMLLARMSRSFSAAKMKPPVMLRPAWRVKNFAVKSVPQARCPESRGRHRCWGRGACCRGIRALIVKL